MSKGGPHSPERRPQLTLQNALFCGAQGKGGAPFTDAELFAVHPVMPSVMEASRLSGYDRRLFERFFKAMLSDANPVTPLSPADLKAMMDAGRLPKDFKGRAVYLGNVCRNKKEILQYMDGSAAVIGDFMLPVLIPGSGEKV